MWLRMKGDYPRACKLRIDGEDAGEWRANGNQRWQARVGQRLLGQRQAPIEIEFSEITWPERMALPWLKKTAQSNDSRPGVSDEFLRAQGCRHVEADEAGALLGFRPSGGGVWIPYPDFSQVGPLVVEGREYGRLRLDKPSVNAKYLSAKGSGAQLYVPGRVDGRGAGYLRGGVQGAESL